MKFGEVLICIFVICQLNCMFGKSGNQRYLTASDGTYYSYLPVELTFYSGSSKDYSIKSKNNYGIRFNVSSSNSTSPQYYTSGHFRGDETSLSEMSEEYFQAAYRNPDIENKILNYHECYKSKKFLAYARTLPHYNDHIFDIHRRIKKGEEFIVPGFRQWFFLWWGENKFHKFIKKEANRIKKFQDRVQSASKVDLKQQNVSQNKQNHFPRLYFSSNKEIDNLVDYSKQKHTEAYEAGRDEDIARLKARLKAIEKTTDHEGACFDYSSEMQCYKFDDPWSEVFNNCYGTDLDKHLHEELCEARAEMQDLINSVDYNNIHVTAFAPIVFKVTAQAKTEKNAIKAFTLSDFAFDLVQILKGGIRIMTLAVNDPSIAGRGIANGVKTVLTLQHWIDLASGTLKLITLFVDEVERQDSLDNSCMASAILGKSDLFLKECEEYEKHCHAQKKALKSTINKTAEKIKNMSDEEFIEGFFKHGTTFVLDLMAFNAAALATTNEGRALVTQYAEVLSSPAAEEAVFEAAGIGKLSLEEGIDAANIAIEIVAKNPNLIKSEGSLLGATEYVIDVEKLAKKIRKIGDDILDVMKKAGGHGLEEHVGKTNDELILRAMRSEIGAASSYPNKSIAIKAVKENLRNNAEDIAQWLKNDAANPKISFDFTHKYPIGSGVLQGKKVPVYDLTKSKVFLKKDPTQDLGFKIVTTFPICN